MGKITQRLTGGKTINITSVLTQTENIQQLVCNIPGHGVSHSRQQDAWMARTFDHAGRPVFVGAVSDGCTNASQDDFSGHLRTFTEHGSRWMVENVFSQSQEQYRKGLRGRSLMKSILLGVVEGMRHYNPRNKASEFIKAKGGIKLSTELVATLFAYVIDEQECVLATAGNGELFVNGKRGTVDQKGGDLYPYAMYSYLPEQWEKHLENMFTIRCFPASEIAGLALGTDGLEDVIVKAIGKFKGKNLEEAFLRIGRDLMLAGQIMDDCTVVTWTNMLARGSAHPNWLDDFVLEASSKSFGAFRSGLETFKSGSPIPTARASAMPSPGAVEKERVQPVPRSSLPVLSGIQPARQGNLRTAGFSPLNELCNYKLRVRRGFGPRHICEVLLRIRQALAAMHEQGQYAGNLRPQDVAVRFVRRTEGQAQGLNDPGFKHGNHSYIRAEVTVNQADVSELDLDFVHPSLWENLREKSTNKQARLDNDCYQFAVLAWWLLSGGDPFGEGVPDVPNHNRRFRMANNHYYWNAASMVSIPTDRLKFLEVGRGRWGRIIQTELDRILSFKTLSLLSAEEFKIIRDQGFRCKYKGGEIAGEGCTLYVHPHTKRCPFCGHKLVQSEALVV